MTGNHGRFYLFPHVQYVLAKNYSINGRNLGFQGGCVYWRWSRDTNTSDIYSGGPLIYLDIVYDYHLVNHLVGSLQGVSQLLQLPPHKTTGIFLCAE